MSGCRFPMLPLEEGHDCGGILLPAGGSAAPGDTWTREMTCADGSFLAPGLFPVENGGRGTAAGDYQNGGSWMLYDGLALYAGMRHNIPSMRQRYADRLVQRMAAELRAGVGTLSEPANRSQEFLCTAPNVAGAPCNVEGSYTLPRMVACGQTITHLPH